MDEKLISLKSVLGERERVYHKALQDYEHYKRNPPGTPDGNVVALEGNVQALFGNVADLMEGFHAYITALEEKLAKGA